MSAHMGRDVRHLNPVDVVVSLHSMIESVLPVPPQRNRSPPDGSGQLLSYHLQSGDHALDRFRIGVLHNFVNYFLTAESLC